MKLPFIQHIGAGIHISDRMIRWVVLSRIQQRIRIDRADRVEVTNGRVEYALKSLVQQIDPPTPYVAANIDPVAARISVLEVPFLEDPEEQERWVGETAAGLLSQTGRAEEFTVTDHLFGDPEEGQHCLFMVTMNRAVQERIDLLESAGLKPVVITSGILEPGYAVMFDEDFNTGRSSLLSVFEDQSVLLNYRDGLLEQVYPLVTGEGEMEEAMAEAESLAVTELTFSDRKQPEIALLSALPGKNEAREPDPGIAGSGRPVFKEIAPLPHLAVDDESLPADFGVACGLAIKHLFPSIDGLNLLRASRLEEASETVQKKDALHMAAGLGGTVGVLLLILLILQRIVGVQIGKTEVQVALVKDKIEALSNARDRIAHLKENVMEAKRLVSERTLSGRLLEKVGKSLPEGVWLNELTLNSKEGWEETEVNLHGFAWDDNLVAALLKQFERGGGIRNVRLVYSEQVKTQEIYADPSYTRRELVQYEVRMKVNQRELFP